MRVTPADLLTIFRLAMTPVFLALFLTGQNVWALIAFCVAGATDLIDGTVARLTRSPSKLGALMDPLADKALIQTCFIALAVVRILPLWFVLLAAARDLMIVMGIMYLARAKFELPFKAIVISKIATFCMLVVAALGLAMRMNPELSFLGQHIVIWLLWAILLTAVLLVISGFKYLIIGFDVLRQRRIYEERLR